MENAENKENTYFEKLLNTFMPLDTSALDDTGNKNLKLLCSELEKLHLPSEATDNLISAIVAKKEIFDIVSVIRCYSDMANKQTYTVQTLLEMLKKNHQNLASNFTNLVKDDQLTVVMLINMPEHFYNLITDARTFRKTRLHQEKFNQNLHSEQKELFTQKAKIRKQRAEKRAKAQQAKEEREQQRLAKKAQSTAQEQETKEIADIVEKTTPTKLKLPNMAD